MVIITIISIIIGLLGIFVSIYFNRKYSKLAQQRYRFSWSDIEKGCRSISNSCLKRFKPDAVLAFSGPGLIFASLSIVYSNRYLPIYIVWQFPLDKKIDPDLVENNILISSSRWNLLIPKSFLNFKNKRITVIHDTCITGRSIMKVISTLVDSEFKRDKIKVACLVCTDIALEAKDHPDNYEYTLENANFHFPWGKRE